MADAHAVDPSDELRHDAGDELFWQESVYLDVADASGELGAYVRLGLYPTQGAAWWTATVVGPGRRPAIAAEYDLPVVAGARFETERGTTSVDVAVEVPLERVRVRSSGTARVLPDAASAYDRDAGEPVPLEVDLTWSTDGTPYHYDVTTRYEIPCTVTGHVVVDGEALAISGPGQRDHSWGVRDWWSLAWCWSAVAMDDGTRLHLANIRFEGVPPLGYVQRDGVVHPLEGLIVTEVLGTEGLPDSARLELEPGGHVLAVEPLAYGPLLLEAPDGRLSRFPRALVRVVDAAGTTGLGWIEWNQPEA
jgi:hypothetical protein